MADSSDVRDAIVALVTGAVYPNGLPSPSPFATQATLSAAAPSGATTISVASAANLQPGYQINLYGGTFESAIVAPSYTVGSTTVPLAAPLAGAHAGGSAAAWLDTCRIMAGWPTGDAIDADMALGAVDISVYGIGAGAPAAQAWEDPEVTTAPVHGLTANASASGQVTITGTPGSGEYITFELDHDIVFSYGAQPGDTNISVAAGIAALVDAQYPGTTASDGVVTVAGFEYLTVRIGAPAVISENLHNQRHRYQVTIFAPLPALRDAVAKIVDPVLKANFRMTMPDTTAATMFADGEADSDESQKTNVYMRRLFYTADYTTIDTYPAYEVTAVVMTIDAADSLITHTDGTATTATVQQVAI